MIYICSDSVFQIPVTMVSFFTFCCIIILTFGWEDEDKDKDKVDFITKEGLQWKLENYPMQLLSQSERRDRSDKLISNFRATISGVKLSGVFSNNTVLQREPNIAALYGTSDSSNVEIIVNIMQIDGNFKDTLNTISMNNNDWKVLLNSAMPNGGNYTISVSCPKCVSPNDIDIIYNITFGDVFYCSGQSNMELDMHFTFSRNITYDSIKSGKYENIRYMTMYEIDTSNITYVVPTITNPANKWNFPANNNTLDKFSAACWYFAQSLYDDYGMKDIQIGLIDTSVGGTMIEQWTRNETIQLFCKDSKCPDPSCGGLYNGLVGPYLNMTIKSFLWYQGENNVYEEPGSWYNFTGYGCMQPFMLRQWRNDWSIIPNTTSSDIPFGLVTLAAGTDEGHGTNMAPFRWAQMGNYDYLPNPINIENINFQGMTNSFAALAHDLGDPWNKQCFYLNPPTCQGNSPYSWNKTNYFMGPIHPRDKLPVGQRLAKSGYPIIYGNNSNKIENEINIGPVINGCKLNNKTMEIIITFNSTFIAKNDKIIIKPFIAWYNTSINYTNIMDWTAMEVEINRVWYFVQSIKEGSDGMSIIADLTSVNNGTINPNTISGIRYAWSTYPCCGNLNRDYNPCPPNSCPIFAANDINNISLPAVPFWSQIINNTCSCFQPQTCSN